MEKFGKWVKEYRTEIVWWTIGWLTFAALEAFNKGYYGLMLLDVGLIYWNYKMWKERDE